MEQATARPLVAVQLPSGPEILHALREAWADGPALLPISPSLPKGEVARLLDELRPESLVLPEGTVFLEDARPVDPEVTVVIATSGSTGAPRGIELTRSALETSAQASLARLRASQGDRWVSCLPPSSIGGLQVLVRSLLLGTDPVHVPRFTPAALASPEGSHVALVPTMLVRLLEAGIDLRRFPHILLGGAAAPAALLERARAAGAHITVTYGMTETAGGCVYDGLPLDGVEVGVEAGSGRIRIRGPVLTRGYRQAGGTLPVTEDGWLRTGDVGRFRPDGRLEVLGRRDDVVVTGGVNVVPSRVAALLTAHPGVAEAEVLGVPDPEWGQRLVAVIVPADPACPPALPVLRNHLAGRAAAPELPRQLVILDRLPLLTSGKVDRLALRARIRT